MKRKAILVLLSFFSFFYVSAQDIIITGKVSDAKTNETLIGVSISIKNSTSGTQSDVNGNYTITAAPNATLVFTYIGYVTQEIPVNGKTVINSVLVTANQSLNEVVVIGYGTQKKRDLTGAITSIKGEEIEKLPNINPISSLQGKVAGLTIVNSGAPGASPTVRIRGVNSTNGAAPVYVVDGVIQDNIDYLNSADIESIDVLKDPSSIAVFGIRGGNGVIAVTTKRAAKGQTRVTYQGSVGIQNVTNTIDVTDAAGFRKLYDQQLANNNAAPFDYSSYNADTDWQDLILRTAVQTNNSLSISNTGEKTTTLINLGYNKQEGVVRYGDFQRFVGRFNQEIRINKNLKLGADITANHYITQGSGVSLNNALWSAPIVPVQFDENTYYSMPSFQRAQVGNPIESINRANGNSINKGYRAVGNVFAEVKFLKQFKLRSAFYTDLSFNGSRGYTPLPNRFINLAEGNAPTDTTINVNGRTSVRQNQDEFRKFQQDHTVSYDSIFNNKHRINAVVGFTSLYEGSTNLSGSRTDTTLNIPRDPQFWYLGIADQINPGNFNGGGGENAILGYLARVSYGYGGKYLLNASIRRDGSSRISPENRYRTFGALGLGWVLSEENFLKNSEKIDFLKIRGSWGTVGNTNGLGQNYFEPNLVQSGVGVFGDNIFTSVTPAFLPDPNLKWETTRGVDVGLDLRAFKNKFSAEIDLYNRKTVDLITRITLPGSSGNITYFTNLGSISNKGVEVALGYNDKIGKDFTFGISPNFSYNKNNVESLGNDFNFTLTGNGGVNRTITGESIGHFFGYRQVGVYQSIADLQNKPAFSNSQVGDIAYADLNGDGVITAAGDREILGSPMPDFNYGFNINTGYKNFDLLLQGQGVAGNSIYTQRRTNSFAILNYESNRLNAWTGAGTSNVEPILDNSRANNFVFSSYYLEPGDYFRLRTVQLGYNVNKDLLSKVSLKGLRVYVSGQNIKTWSKATGYSPEVPIGILAGGADNGVYPLPAVYTFGINATF
ncbi:SusC/RagA family TonB-linked outer membrane protein [Pedobacter psychrophilus]|uniref:SusC/RagA family TonB-linked outer membrane protein n=1 Tax=Pedobacter psychrophilus TaxID=1826909 RepID=A0A179DDJ0_9SPHI|nr:TonB-dependent receptor [Pedobacter psychrophilus]OAQ39101.1 SusC/RagA family TonB-linked outer membrane protein [Pedobacter psychrophilus]